jgi:AcrR family transcriptional regulator
MKALETPGSFETPSVRESIISACERVLAKVGYERMTMADVAAEAGLTRKTLYLHFGTKEALVRESVERVVARALAGMERCLNAESGAEALRGMLAERILNRLESVGPFHHTTDELMSVLRPHNSRFHLAHYEREILLVVRAIEHGISDGTFRSSDPRGDAEVLIRATNAFLPSSLPVLEARDFPGVRRKLHRLVAILVAGLSSEAMP